MNLFSRDCHPRERLFYVLALVLIAYCFTLHVARLEQITFVIHDDLMADLTAQAMRSDGIAPYLSYAHYAATRDGRFFYYYSIGFLVLPYLFDSAVARAIFVALIQFTSLFCIGWYLAFFVRRTTALLFVVLACAFLPNWSMHFPVTSLPIVFQASTLLFFSALILNRLAAKRTLEGRRSPYLRGSSYTLFLLSCLVAEVATFFFLLIVFLDAVQEDVHDTRRLDWRTPVSLLRRRKVFLALVLMVVIVYLVTSPLYHPTYTGTQLSLSPSKALPTLLRYAIRGLPAANFIVPDYFTVHWLHRAPADASLRNLTRDYLSGDISFLLILLSATCTLCLWKRPRPGSGSPEDEDGRSAAKPNWRRAPVIVFACSLTLAFAVQIPLALTLRYQSQTILDIYYPTYYSFLCFIAAGAVLPSVLQPLLTNWIPRGVNAVVVLGVCLACYGCFLTQVANGVTFREQAAFGRRWRLINAWFATNQFLTLPSGAILVSPSLWQGIDETVVPDYWTNYIRLRTGRKLPVRRNTARLDASTPVYYLHLDNRDAASGGALFVSGVNWKKSDADASGFVLSDDVTVVSDGEPKSVALSVLTRPPGERPPQVRSLETTDEGVRRVFGPLQFRRERGQFTTVVAVPGAVSGTATLIDAANVTAGRSLLVDLAFGAGFEGLEGLESKGGEYWRWCASPAGEGAITFTNRLPYPINVRFRANLFTGSSDRTKFEFRRPEGVEVQYVDNRGILLDTQILLAPGSNTFVMKSYAPRLIAPDPRYLVFRIVNWDLSYELAPVTAGDVAAGPHAGPALKLSFGKGFSDLEGREELGSEYWRWSDGPSGEASLRIDNARDRVVKARFRAFVSVGTPANCRFETRFGGDVAVTEVNQAGTWLERTLDLKPGSNEIVFKAYAPRVKGPDPRHLVFRVAGWQLTALSPR